MKDLQNRGTEALADILRHWFGILAGILAERDIRSTMFLSPSVVSVTWRSRDKWIPSLAPGYAPGYWWVKWG